MLPAGRLRHRVELQAKSVTRDAMGGEVVTWTKQSSAAADGLWAARVEALSGKALMAAQQAQSEVTARILMRNNPAVQADWRVLHGSAVYAIHAIIPDADGVSMNLQCAKGLLDG